MLTSIDVIDHVLERHASRLGRDFNGYRHHAYRVANLCLALAPDGDPDRIEKIGIAAVFHDLGIWTAGTFDYVPPSLALLDGHLAQVQRTAWQHELGAMIREHHKLSPHRSAPGTLVEPFRRADLVDVSCGLITFGLPRTTVRALYQRWPDAGFHRCLARLSVRRLVTHPWNPLPMVRL